MRTELSKLFEAAASACDAGPADAPEYSQPKATRPLDESPLVETPADIESSLTDLIPWVKGLPVFPGTSLDAAVAESRLVALGKRLAWVSQDVLLNTNCPLSPFYATHSPHDIVEGYVSVFLYFNMTGLVEKATLRSDMSLWGLFLPLLTRLDAFLTSLPRGLVVTVGAVAANVTLAEDVEVADVVTWAPYGKKDGKRNGELDLPRTSYILLTRVVDVSWMSPFAREPRLIGPANMPFRVVHREGRAVVLEEVGLVWDDPKQLVAMRRQLRTTLLHTVSVPISPPPVDAILRFRMLGHHEFAIKNYDKAIEAYTAAIELDPNDVALRCARSYTYIAMKSFPQAIADAYAATQIDIKSRPAHQRLALAFIRNGQTTQAMEVLKQAWVLGPGNRDTESMMDECLQKDAAVFPNAVARVQTNHPLEAMTARDIVKFVHSGAIPTDAIPDVRDYFEKFATNTPLFTSPLPAIEFIEKTSGAESVQVGIFLVHIGCVYGAVGAFVMAKPILERALVILQLQCGANHPEVATTLANLGNVYGSLGDYEKKLEFSLRSFEIVKNHFGLDTLETGIAYDNLGMAYHVMQRYDLAKENLQKALNLYEAHRHPNRFHLGMVLMRFMFDEATDIEHAHRHVIPSMDLLKNYMQ